jgi:hypothetical protein
MKNKKVKVRRIDEEVVVFDGTQKSIDRIVKLNEDKVYSLQVDSLDDLSSLRLCMWFNDEGSVGWKSMTLGEVYVKRLNGKKNIYPNMISYKEHQIYSIKKFNTKPKTLKALYDFDKEASIRSSKSFKVDGSKQIRYYIGYSEVNKGDYILINNEGFLATKYNSIQEMINSKEWEIVEE